MCTYTFVCIILTDTPSKATNLQFLEYDEYHIDIAWNKPNYVGGGPITGYIVEYKVWLHIRDYNAVGWLLCF